MHMRGSGKGLALAIALATMLGGLLSLSTNVQAQNGVDYIVILDAPGGRGWWIGNRTYYVGEGDTFWAAGYNYTTGYVEDVDAYWYSEDPSVGSVDPRGRMTNFSALSGGTTIVHAMCYDGTSGGCNGTPPGNQTNLWNGTGTLTVIYNPVDYVVIRDSPGGIGAPVRDREYFEGDVDVFWAAGYNYTLGYVGDLPSAWESNNTTVAEVDPFGASATFHALSQGTAVANATYNGTVTNVTGTLTVRRRPAVYVDDDGVCSGLTPCYLTIQEGVDAAGDGWLVSVFDGDYGEHVIVNHSVEIRGQSTDGVLVDGGGTGTVFLITGDDVTIETITVQNGAYGILVEHAVNTRMGNSTISDYVYGIYLNYTQDAYVAFNLITRGRYGIITDHAYNDAVRWNEISYNTVYGAKDFESQLRNCFNWNRFHHNKVGYYYDPDLPLLPLEFDGNVLEDNEVGILVEGASTVVLTNNALRRNGIGVEIRQASPLVANNVLEDNDVGISCSQSGSRIADNDITGGSYGVSCLQYSGQLDGNLVRDAAVAAVSLDDSSGASALGNDLGGGAMLITDGDVTRLELVDTKASALGSTIGTLVLDDASELAREWMVSFKVVDGDGGVVDGASVALMDSRGTLVATVATSAEGVTPPVQVLDRVERAGSTESWNPYRVDVSKEGTTVTKYFMLASSSVLTVAFMPQTTDAPFPWLFLLVFGSVAALGVGGLLSLEVVRYGLLGLFVPLYIKLRKDRVMDHYTRGRIYQYLDMNPGEHFTSIKSALGLNNGTAVYHLEVLEREGLLKSRTDGIFKRFYPAHMQLPAVDGGRLTEVQTRIVEAVRDLPGITQKEIAGLLGLRQSTLSYQLKRLKDTGHIEAKKDGRWTRYFPAEEAGGT